MRQLRLSPVFFRVLFTLFNIVEPFDEEKHLASCYNLLQDKDVTSLFNQVDYAQVDIFLKAQDHAIIKAKEAKLQADVAFYLNIYLNNSKWSRPIQDLEIRHCQKHGIVWLEAALHFPPVKDYVLLHDCSCLYRFAIYKNLKNPMVGLLLAFGLKIAQADAIAHNFNFLPVTDPTPIMTLLRKTGKKIKME